MFCTLKSANMYMKKERNVKQQVVFTANITIMTIDEVFGLIFMLGFPLMWFVIAILDYIIDKKKQNDKN